MFPKIYGFASINIDDVYSVPHIVRPGETLSSTKRQQNAGGKGTNASIAASYGGGNVHVIGKIGPDGEWVRDLIIRTGANTEHITVVPDGFTGRAIIQVDAQGENSIVLFPGANHRMTEEDAHSALAQSNPGDWLLLTNETTAVAEAIRVAHSMEMRVLWNPAPMDQDLVARGMPIEHVDVLVVNETELRGLAAQIDGIDVEENTELCKQKCTEIARQVMNKFGNQVVAVTLGSEGSVALVRRPKTNTHAIPTTNKVEQGEQEDGHSDIAEISLECAPIRKQYIKDTTGAGDTWVGYFAAELARTQGNSPESIGSLASLTPAMVEQAMLLATFASGLAVTQMGAVPSIPKRQEVEVFIKTKQFSP
ncbi:putative ribokinase [Coemansia sp. RSA 1722]|nr:putative ribokinase [Coemansia sp. RSA 486]KAJ2232554.1 putative ribokinase [Coemansia sp. RSA 485]KAJ2600835.1 putative ribokinase [Coemansia sp. RSA 1721]KAJ2605193.1 putative ribokinase [Coemansia sp. RSA 1722]KAJ2638352.1 putative ribokinase [Coemansia sp. RSA 1286]